MSDNLAIAEGKMIARQIVESIFPEATIKTKMRILGNRVLISPLPVREVSEGGIVLPQAQVGDVMQHWRVEQVGSGSRGKDGELVPPEFTPGDLIITPLHFSHHSMEDGSGWKIIDAAEIIGKFEPDAPVPDV